MGHTLHAVSTEILFIIPHYFCYFRLSYFKLQSLICSILGVYFPILFFSIVLTATASMLYIFLIYLLILDSPTQNVSSMVTGIFFCFVSPWGVLTQYKHTALLHTYLLNEKKSLPHVVLGVQKRWLIVGNYEIYNMIPASGDHLQDVARGVDYWAVWRESLLELQKSKRP